MSLKTELKVHVLHEQGVKADDMLEAATRRQAAHDGAKQALRATAKLVAQLAAVVDKDLEDGKIPFEEPLKVAAYAKLMVDRAVNSVLGAAQHQENLQIATGGEIVAYQNLVNTFKKDIQVEQGKLDLVKTLAANPDAVEVDHRSVGAHPPTSIAAQRRAEDASPPEVTTDGTSVAKNGKRGGKKKGG